MKKTLLLISLFAFSVTAIYAQTGWVTHKCDERVSVKFPIEPKELQPGTVMAAPDSSMVYILTIVDFTQFGMDSVALAPVKTTPEFAEQIKTGMTGSMPGVTLDDFKIGDWKGFTTYTSAGVNAKRKKFDVLMILVGTKMYSLSTVRLEGIPAKSKDDYFASVMLNKP
jgi:hypothetical protein